MPIAKYRIDIEVAGQQYQGSPVMEIYADGRKIASEAVTGKFVWWDDPANAWQTFSYDLDAPSLGRIEVRFVNDLAGIDGDRNLFISKVSVNDVVVGGMRELWSDGSRSFDASTVPPLGSAPPTDPQQPVPAPVEVTPTNPALGLWVGPNEQYKTLAEAVAASKAGDTILLRAGTYENDWINVDHALRIVGVDGKAHLKSTDQIDNGKAIIVARADLQIENLEFSGASVSDGNGAGIRYEAGQLVVRNSVFRDNENGVLAASNKTGTITIEGSSFLRNGAGDGYTHGIYVNEIARLTVRDSVFEGNRIGHSIKSRALDTLVEDNSIKDGPFGSTSYGVDISNGGTAVIRNNEFHKGVSADNSAFIGFAMEGSRPTDSLLVEGNVFRSDFEGTTAVFSGSSSTVRLVGNDWNDPEITRISNGAHAVEAGPTPNPGSNPGPGTDPVPGPIEEPSTSTIVLRVASDHYLGAAQFKVTVDGQVVDQVFTATADHRAGQWGEVTLTGDFGADGPSQVEVTFLNDKYAGTSAKDRNLWVDRITVDGRTYEGESALKSRAGQAMDSSEMLGQTGTKLLFDLTSVTRPVPGFKAVADWASGGAVARTFTGTSRDDVMKGTDGNDRLNGGTGADTMTGGKGDDTYRVERATDRIVEKAAQGIDTAEVQTTAYTLPEHVENLVIVTSAGARVVGNALDNVIRGGSGADRIEGGAGADLLSGGAGADRFVIKDAAHGGDVILDFERGKDTLDLTGAIKGRAGAWIDLVQVERGTAVVMRSGHDDLGLALLEGVDAQDLSVSAGLVV